QWYCGIDSWAGLEGAINLRQDLKEKHVPESLYRDLMKLSEISDLMQRRGVAIDHEFVANLEKNFEQKKAEIFPFEMVNGKPVYQIFNPKSVKQVLDYFSSHGILLPSTDKSDIRAVLEKEARRAKISVDELETAELPEALDNLHRLWQYKDAGKGLSSWFAAK